MRVGSILSVKHLGVVALVKLMGFLPVFFKVHRITLLLPSQRIYQSASVKTNFSSSPFFIN